MMAAQKELVEIVRATALVEFHGRITAIGQRSITADGPHCRVGDVCRIGDHEEPALAEVVAISTDRIELLPLEDMPSVRIGDRVTLAAHRSGLLAGDALAGRAIDGFGRPIDGGPAIMARTRPSPRPEAGMSKVIIPTRICTGIRTVDGLLPIAQGQRIGIFAASGAGKTTMIEHLSRHVSCDRIVLCLIGERGREIERLWGGRDPLERSPSFTLVAATSDQSASARVRAMRQALAMSEYWRDRGEHVVLLVDSVTRLAMALREIGLAAGEPPALRSYTPNVFAALPEFVERCGAVREKGAITAIFTVLSETDDVDDPIVETMKSLLDGHIVLSRKLAERGHFPAIDVGSSVSRVADQVLDAASLERARQFRRLVATYEESRPMVESGLYLPGSNPDVDRAIALRPLLEGFLMQSGNEAPDLASCDSALRSCLQGSGA